MYNIVTIGYSFTSSYSVLPKGKVVEALHFNYRQSSSIAAGLILNNIKAVRQISFGFVESV